MKKIVVFALFILFFAVSCDSGFKPYNPNDKNSDAYHGGDDADSTDDKDSSDSADDPDVTDTGETVGEKRVSECTGLPENAVWNPVSSINQTWDGEKWIPSMVGTYSEKSCYSECCFKCDTNYNWNGEKCLPDADTSDSADDGDSGKNDDNDTSIPDDDSDSSDSAPDADTEDSGADSGADSDINSDDDSDSIPGEDKNDAEPQPDEDSGTNDDDGTSISDDDTDSSDSAPDADTGDSGSSTLTECSSNTTSFPCKDPDTGYIWSKMSSSAMNYTAATTFCQKDLELGGMKGYGGFTDWRLPTISELRTLIQDCPATQMPPSGSDVCKARSDEGYVCLSNSCRTDPCGGCSSDSSGGHSKFGDTGWFWSSSLLSGSSNIAWLVGFNGGGVSLNYIDNYYVRCVR